jgi:acetyl-CoA carboxylase / biotin carboxylase 1
MCNITRLRDGGRLVRLADRSHVAYTIPEPAGMRLVLDGTTCMFTNEYDPTQLRASMSGKLARFLVDDGAVVLAGQAFAEVEVMKMYMTLQVPETGTVHFCKLEGSVLESGELIATVTLEDPSKVHKVCVCAAVCVAVWRASL